MVEEIITQTESVEVSISLPNGQRLAAKRWGAITKPDTHKIIALHGWLDNASSWDGIAPHLAKKGAVVIALDFIGHGKSDHQQDTDYALFYHALNVISAVNVIGWQNFSLLAHSMGAFVATQIAAIIPEKIITLTLVEGIGNDPVPLNAVQILKIAIKSRSTPFFDRQPKLYPDIKSAVRKFRENNSLEEHSASLIALRSLVKVQDGYSFSHDPRLVGGIIFRYDETDIGHFVKGIKCPVLLFWTRKTLDWALQTKIDNTTRYQIFQERFKLLNPTISKQVILEEGGHHVHLDRPDLVFPHIEKFYDQFIHNPSAKL